MESRSFFILFWIILGVVSIFYGLIVRAVGSGTLFFLFWILLGVMCFGLSYFIKMNFWELIPRGYQTWIRLMYYGILLCFVCVEILISSGFDKHDDVPVDYVIVLGAQVYKKGPSPVLKFRLDRAVEYLEKYPETICIVSGGQGYNEPASEASVMADYLVAHGISENRILQEDKSTTTAENMEFSKPMIAADAKVGIITNNFHIYRAKLIARKAGIQNTVGIPAKTTPLYLPNNMVREFFAIMKMMMKGPVV